MKTARKGFRSMLTATAALLAGACSILEPREDPTRFFVLTASEVNAAPPADAGAADAAKSSIGFGPVSLPPYLERPEIVRRSGEHELAPSRVDRWGESLEQGTLRVLAQDLAQAAGRRVVPYPWKTAVVPPWTVEVAITRFEAVEEKRVELIADVDVRRAADAAPVRRHERIDVALAGTEGGAIAKAMSEALAGLAGKIAAQIASMDGAH